MRAGVRDYSVSGPFCRSGESLRVLLFNFHKINQAKKKTGKDFPDAFPAGNFSSGAVRSGYPGGDRTLRFPAKEGEVRFFYGQGHGFAGM